MTQLWRLPSLGKKRKSKKRKGQGLGSGRGKTAGRGTKGQGAHSRVAFGFETGSRTTRLLKRLPYNRGVGNIVLRKKPLVINLADLNIFPANSEVTEESLIKMGLVKRSEMRRFGVKILGDGKLASPLSIGVPISKQASQKVTAAGGRFVKKGAKL